MAPLQGALPPLAAPAGLLHTSSLGAPLAHPSALLPNGPPYASIMPSSTLMSSGLVYTFLFCNHI